MAITTKPKKVREASAKGRSVEVVKKSPVRKRRTDRDVPSEADRVVPPEPEHDAPETTEIDSRAEAEPDNDSTAATSDAVPESTGSGRRGLRRPRWSTRRWRPRRLLAALAVVALCVGGGFAGWQLYSNHAVAQAEEQAIATARDYAVTLTSIEANDIDQNFTDVLDGATGEFKDMYSRSSSQLKQMLIDNKATSKGVVVDAGVKSATADRVVVMLFVDQSITNTASPQPRVDRSRVLMTMDKVDGRWLASKVDLP